MKFKQMRSIYMVLSTLFVFRDSLERQFLSSLLKAVTKENRERVIDGHILAVSVMWDKG